MQRSVSMRNTLLIWLAVASLTLTAIQPFLQNTMLMTADGTLHLYRLVALDHAMADGSLWSRYVAGMVYGYGSPMFNYYSPSSLYLMQGISVVGVSFMQAWLLGMIVYAFVAGLGAFYLGRAWAGTVGGIVMVVAYGYAPYTLFDSIWRGTVSEFASLALLPWVLWGIWRVAQYGKRRDVLMTAAVFALYFTLHNVITLHSSILIGAYTLVVWLYSTDRLRTLLHLGIALGAGLLMVTFFWLPALSETDYVKIDAITANLPEIDVIGNLTHLGEVLRLPITADPTQLEPSVPVTLNLLQLFFAALALLLVFIRKTPTMTRVIVAIFALLTGFFVFMNLTASSYLWEVIPLIRYSQFPWRLIGLASLTVALMASISVAQLAQVLKSTPIRLTFVGAVLVAFMFYAMPWIYSSYLPDVDPQSIVDAQNFERESGYIGTSSFAEYVPIWSSELPDENRLVPHFEADEIISRLEPPESVTIAVQEWTNTSGKFTYLAENDTDVVLDWFYFPGWVAEIDGESIPIAPTEPEGLITLTLPAGTHTAKIALMQTDRQNLSVMISAGALLILSISMVVPPLWKKSQSVPESYTEETGTPTLLMTVIVIGLAVFAFKGLVIDRINSPIRQERFAQGVEAGVDIAIQANFADQITLLGADNIQQPIASGQSFLINTYWQARQVIEADYSLVLSLYDTQGNVISQITDWRPGGVTTSHWLSDFYVKDSTQLQIPADTPPGAYQLKAEMYQPATGASLNVLNEVGNPTGVDVTIGTVNVSRPDDTTSDVMMDVSVDASLGGVRLLGFNALPEEIGVGESFLLETLWTTETQGTVSPDLSLIWVRDGQLVASSEAFPPVPMYPVEQWQSGDVWQGKQRLYVPGNLDAGQYDVLLNESDIVDGVRLGEMTITTPERVYTMPEDIEPTNIRWQNGIVLNGMVFDDSQLTLFWRAETLLSDDLRVFVHFVDENERIVHQFDGRPANWARPTTSWDVDEIIQDSYKLPDIGGLQLRVGWYDARTGDRIMLETGDEYYEIAR